MKYLFFPNLRLFLSKPIGNLTMRFTCHQPDFWSRFFLTITLRRRKNPKEIHFKPGFKVGWQTFASGKIHRIDRIFWYDWNAIKGRITYKRTGYNRMKRLGRVNNEVCRGKQEKRLVPASTGWVVSIHRNSCAMMQGMCRCLPFSEYDWPKGSGI